MQSTWQEGLFIVIKVGEENRKEIKYEVYQNLICSDRKEIKYEVYQNLICSVSSQFSMVYKHISINISKHFHFQSGL